MIHDILVEYENILFVACNDKVEILKSLNGMGINARAYDYDPKFEGVEYYETKDFVFDEVEFEELVVNWNCEKTYPLGRLFQGDMILIGDNKKHNGDCNPVVSTQQLIDQNNIIKVYNSFEYKNHYVVHGSNLS